MEPEKFQMSEQTLDRVLSGSLKVFRLVMGWVFVFFGGIYFLAAETVWQEISAQIGILSGIVLLVAGVRRG